MSGKSGSIATGVAVRGERGIGAERAGSSVGKREGSQMWVSEAATCISGCVGTGRAKYEDCCGRLVSSATGGCLPICEAE